MWGALARAAAPFFGRRARLRWLHLVLGGALLMPYFLVTLVAVQLVGGEVPQEQAIVQQVVAYLLALPLVAVTGLFPVVRVLEGAAARALLGTAVRAGGERRRTAVFFVAHLGIGGACSALILAVPPAAVILALVPSLDRAPLPGPVGTALLAPGPWAPVLGLLLLVALVAGVTAAGAVLDRLATALLGETAADRLAELERRAARLTGRNRLARELHDSVGHALSVVAVQAGAAQRLLATDPAFADRALSAIGDAARTALADLDHVLGLLREEDSGTAPTRSLRDLDDLVRQVRLAGTDVTAEVTGDVDAVPPAVSREAYRIVQEGLTNALRHAGTVPVALRVHAGPDDLEVEMTNPSPGTRRGRGVGGRGITGITERVAVLGGEATAGRDGDVWRVTARLPIRPAR